MPIYDDDELAYACDVCGEEFDSQAALDGHEADGRHDEPFDPDQPPSRTSSPSWSATRRFTPPVRCPAVHDRAGWSCDLEADHRGPHEVLSPARWRAILRATAPSGGEADA